MSQVNFIRAVVTHMAAPDLLDAITKDVDAQTALDNLRVFFDAHADALGTPVTTASILMQYVFNTDATAKQQARRAFAEQATAVVREAFAKNPPAPADVANDDWRTALKHLISADGVEALAALDQVGLVDRTAPVVLAGRTQGQLHHLWKRAIEHSAARCNRYLLTTTSLAELGGFPREAATWPKTMNMARDLVSHIADADLPAVLESLREHVIDSDDGELNRSADMLVPAFLERCSQHPELLRSESFEQLVIAVQKRVASRYGDELNAGASVAMLGVLERAGQLNTVGAYRIAEKVLLKEGGNRELIAPDYLKHLIGQGLPVQSAPDWFGAENSLHHLLVMASERHFEVLSERVPDKTVFMQHYGWDIVNRNSSEPAHNGIGLSGAENTTLRKLAALGYPLGPIDIPAADGGVKRTAVYERISGAKAADAFLIGHLAGHLDDSHKFDGADPMHVAVAYQSAPTIEALAGKGFSLDSPCHSINRHGSDYRRSFGQYKGMTPLVMALKLGNIDCIRALVDAGADPSIKAPTGASTMQLAKTEEIKQLLRSARTGKALNTTIKSAAPAGESSATKKKPGLGML